MKLHITLCFGTQGMHRYSQARAVLKDGLGLGDRYTEPKVGDSGVLRDANERRVGEWEVTE